MLLWLAPQRQRMLDAYSHHKIRDDDPLDDRREDVEAEAADVAICLINFCNRTGIDLGDAVVRKLSAAALKYPKDRVKGRREKYDEYPEWTGESE